MSSMKEATHAAPAPPSAGAANGNAGPIPYIGSRISLISKSAIRYEGTLYTIDTNESTVALQNVRSFGTEGRARPGGPIPPSPEVYEYIIFRGPDILDLQVLRTETPKPTPHYHDPAIVSSLAATPPPPLHPHGAGVNQGVQQSRPANGVGSTREHRLPQPAQIPAQPPKPIEKQSAHPGPAPTLAAWGPPPQSREWGPPPQPSNKQPYQTGRTVQSEHPKREGASSASNWRVNAQDGDRGRDRMNNGFGDVRRGDGRDGGGRSAHSRYSDTNGGGGGRPVGRGGRGHGGRGRRQRRRGPGITVPDEDFDFESMHEKFDKVALSEETNGVDDGGLTAPPVAVKYDRSNGFFDELVPEKQMPRERSNAAQRRATDMETFGEAGSSYRYRNYRGRGRRGGGGRGRRNQTAFRNENAN